jgi:hypothetical protein
MIEIECMEWKLYVGRNLTTKCAEDEERNHRYALAGENGNRRSVCMRRVGCGLFPQS